MLQHRYPEYILIENISFELNLNKREIRKIVNLAISGKIEEVVVVHNCILNVILIIIEFR
jgi:hypothetical protein